MRDDLLHGARADVLVDELSDARLALPVVDALGAAQPHGSPPTLKELQVALIGVDLRLNGFAAV